MKSSSPQIGFDRYVELDWCQAALEVAADTKSMDQLRAMVAVALPGIESQRKTIDVVKRLWIKPFPGLEDFLSRGLTLYRQLGSESVLPLTWGMAIASYPFFGKTAEISGRLLAIQGDCSIKEIQRRMAEAYGDRSGVERAVARVLQSQANWGGLKRKANIKRILKILPTAISNDALTTWIIEAAVRFSGKPLPVPALQSLPVLFPLRCRTSGLGFFIYRPLPGRRRPPWRPGFFARWGSLFSRLRSGSFAPVC